MKPFVVGRAVILVLILISVLMIPSVYAGQQTETPETPVLVGETRAKGTLIEKNDVVFQRVIAELVKTFYIA